MGRKPTRASTTAQAAMRAGSHRGWKRVEVRCARLRAAHAAHAARMLSTMVFWACCAVVPRARFLRPRALKSPSAPGLGLPEKEEDPTVVSKKILKLADMIRKSKSCVVLTGAGISTSAGVSDFRGPNGVWTAEKKGVAPPASKSFENVQPTLTHMALVGLVQAGLVKLVISQNVDGLHLRSNLARNRLAELHGNLFVESCEVCGWEYLRDFDVGGISFSKTGRTCERKGCGGALRNNLLDWEDDLPEQEFQLAEDALRESDLCICMGTSLRIRPASELPLLTVKNGGKLVLLNLQKTPKDRQAHLRIQAPVDRVLMGVMAVLGLPVPPFTRSLSLIFVAKQCTEQHSEGKVRAGAVKNEMKVDADVGGEEQRALACDAAAQEAHLPGASGRIERIALKAEKGQEYAADRVLWSVEVQSVVGRGCPLPLIERVDWHDARARDSMAGVVALERTMEGVPGKLSAEIFLANSCSFPSKSIVIEKGEWVRSRRDEGVEREQGLEGTAGTGRADDFDEGDEWHAKMDLEVVELDYNARPREGIVHDVEEQAARAPAAAKRRLEEDRNVVPKKSPWRKCATCGKTGRIPEKDAGNYTEAAGEEVAACHVWYCRRRCVPSAI